MRRSFFLHKHTMNTNKIHVGEITPELIAGWKTEHTVIFKISTEDGSNTAIVRRPTLAEVEYGQALLGQNKIFTFNINLFKTCLLGWEIDVSDDEYALNSLASNMMQCIEVVRSQVEKL